MGGGERVGGGGGRLGGVGGGVVGVEAQHTKVQHVDNAADLCKPPSKVREVLDASRSPEYWVSIGSLGCMTNHAEVVSLT